MGTSKQQTLNDLFDTLKQLLSEKYLVLRNVELSTILPFSRAEFLKGQTADLVVARKDYSPLVIIDIAEEFQTKADRERELSKEKALLLDARIPVLHLDSGEAPNTRELLLLIEEAEANHLQLISEITQNVLDSNKNNPVKAKKKDPLEKEKEESPNRIALKRYTKAVVILLAGFAVFHTFAPKSNKDSKISISTPQPQETLSKEDVPIRTARKPVSTEVPCDQAPPQNGAVKILDQELKSTGKAYWTFDNKSNLHSLVSIVLDKKKISEIYIAPHSKSTLATYPLPYRYVINTTNNWCNSQKTINPGGYSGDSTSRGALSNRFGNNTMATTTIMVINGNLNTNTEIDEVEGN